MSIATLSTYTVRVTPRYDAPLMTRVMESVAVRRLSARQRREQALALAGEFGPAQRDDVLAALGRR